jgi:hypothetical protein
MYVLIRYIRHDEAPTQRLSDTFTLLITGNNFPAIEKKLKFILGNQMKMVL